MMMLWSFSMTGSIFLTLGLTLEILSLSLGKFTLISIQYPLSNLWVNLTINFNFDWMSLSFTGTVFLISGSVLIYSQDYMSSDLNKIRFLYLLILFIMSMSILVLSSNLLTIIIGWDALGLSSYLLVIFYQNESSYKAGFITIMSNRIGDVTLLLAIGWSLNLSTWNMITMKNMNISTFIMMMLLISALTKSAQFPFSAWLPAASAAPTPVSSLVHSSTLVTAGVYLMIRFHYIFHSNFFKLILSISCILTMLMAGWAALHEMDLKKIIAMSTLSQLGFMMFSLLMGLYELTFLHMTTHAFFKALMFLSGGWVIHSHKGIQDLRIIMSTSIPIIPSMGLMISIFALTGFPFLAGFYTKDLILEHVMATNTSLMVLISLMIAVMTSTLYSTRMLIMMFSLNSKFSPQNISHKMNYKKLSMSFLILLSIFSGSLLQWYYTPHYTILPTPFKMTSLFLILSFIFSMTLLQMLSLTQKKIFFSSSHELWFLTPLTEKSFQKFPKMAKFFKSMDYFWMETTSTKMPLKISKFFLPLLESTKIFNSALNFIWGIILILIMIYIMF